MNTEITVEQFIAATGRKPENDDMERVNCTNAGEIGHHNCGWCHICDKPYFACHHLAEKATQPTQAEIIADLKAKNAELTEQRDQARKMAIEKQFKIIQLDERVEAMQADAKLSDMAWKDNQAALKAQAETIARLTAELAQCKHALDDESLDDAENVCVCGHRFDNHSMYGSGCLHEYINGDFCACKEGYK